MRFISLFSAFAAAAAVNATSNSTEIEIITQDLKSGDLVGAAIEILSLGDCDAINLAGKFSLALLPQQIIISYFLMCTELDPRMCRRICSSN